MYLLYLKAHITITSYRLNIVTKIIQPSKVSFCIYLMFMIEASIKYVVYFINKLTAMKLLWAIFFIMPWISSTLLWCQILLLSFLCWPTCYVFFDSRYMLRQLYLAKICIHILNLIKLCVYNYYKNIIYIKKT